MIRFHEPMVSGEVHPFEPESQPLNIDTDVVWIRSATPVSQSDFRLSIYIAHLVLQ
jgi:hypothetical protein